jgi:DNA polymerase III epsilon subunit-like protein
MNKKLLARLMDNWMRGPYVILDTETTGLGPDAEIIEISVIDMGGETLLDTLVRPSKPIPAEITAINNITNEMVADAPVWADVYPLLMEILYDHIYLAWNSNFDSRLIAQTTERSGFYGNANSDIALLDFELITLNHVDARHIYSMWYGETNEDGLKRQRLQNAVIQQGVKLTGTAHRSLSDCHSVLSVINAVLVGEL